MPKKRSFDVVLDTSALIAYLTNEPEAEHVAGLKSKAALPFMALTELYYLVYREKGKAGADKIFSTVRSWGLPVIHSTDQILYKAGQLKAIYKLGIADSFVAATALINQVPLATKDPDYDVLVPALSLIKLQIKTIN